MVSDVRRNPYHGTVPVKLSEGRDYPRPYFIWLQAESLAYLRTLLDPGNVSVFKLHKAYVWYVT